MNRPMVWAAAAMVVGIAAAEQSTLVGLSLPLVLLPSALLLILLGHGANRYRWASIFLLFVAFGAVNWTIHSKRNESSPLTAFLLQQDSHGETTVEGTVRLARLDQAETRYSGFLIDVTNLILGTKKLPMRGGLLVRWNKPSITLSAGDKVRVKGRASFAIGRANPGMPDLEDQLRREGIQGSIRIWGPADVELLRPGAWYSIRHVMSQLHTMQTTRLKKVVPVSSYPFVVAIWLGDRAALAKDEYLNYQYSGTAHVLSVSGLHVVLIYVTSSFLLSLFVRSRKKRAILVTLFVLAFALMSGARPSGLRAALMVAVYMAAELFDREPDGPNALGLSAFLLLTWSPQILFDSGFLLSFLSVASIMLFGTPFHEHLGRVPRLIRGTLSTSLAVQLLPMPLSVFCFHTFPLTAIPANLLVIPLSAAVLWLAMLTSLIATIWTAPAMLLGYATVPLVWAIRITSKAFAYPSFLHPHLPAPSIPAMVAFWLAVAALYYALRDWRRPFSIALFLLLIGGTVLLWNSARNPSEIVFLDVGHGDAALVRSPGGKTLLIDTGDCSERVDMGRYVIEPYLWSNQITHLDYLAISHPDRDHIGGAPYLLEHFRVGEVWLSSATSDKPLELELLQICAQNDIPVRRLSKGDLIDAGGAQIEVLHPPPGWHADANPNENSLVLRYTCRNTGVMFSGDIEEAAERAIASTECRADILKVPHHGSRTSSSEALLRAVSPKYGIVSTGGESGREPVEKAVLSRYGQRSIPLYRTDIHGGIRVQILSDRFTLEPARHN